MRRFTTEGDDLNKDMQTLASAAAMLGDLPIGSYDHGFDDANEVRIEKKILDYAANLVDSGWVKGKYAADKYGDNCHPEDPEAELFCGRGAILRATAILGRKDLRGIIFDAVEATIQDLDYYELDREYSDSELVYLNDRKAESAEDVSSVLRETGERF